MNMESNLTSDICFWKWVVTKNTTQQVLWCRRSCCTLFEIKKKQLTAEAPGKDSSWTSHPHMLHDMQFASLVIADHRVISFATTSSQSRLRSFSGVPTMQLRTFVEFVTRLFPLSWFVPNKSIRQMGEHQAKAFRMKQHCGFHELKTTETA